MTIDQGTENLYDPRNGDLALQVGEFRIEPIDPLDPTSAQFSNAARTNYFSVNWVRKGRGRALVDTADHAFQAPALLCFSPYQSVRLVADEPLHGVRLHFHANFLCIETYHEEVGCNGVLFNDVLGIPVVPLDEESDRELGDLVGQIRRELAERGLAHSELLLSYLKVLLIRATRWKQEQQATLALNPSTRLPPEFDQLRELIERHYKELHAPADYARLLNTDPKTLGKLVKAHLHKTLTELIRERILKQAKWDLLHTLKPVKQVAHELGYTDELYFSRLFKRATGYSPLFFREYETAIRGGKNLSMTLPLSSIPSGPDFPKNREMPEPAR